MKVKIKVKKKAAKETEVQNIAINTEFIKLDSFLKFASLVPSGGDAKMMITDGLIKVNDKTCTQRGKKLRPGDVIDFDGELFKITGEE